MDPVQQKLERLRVWFFVWFVGQAAIGIVTAAWVLDGLGRSSILRFALGGGLGAVSTVAAGTLVSLVLLFFAGLMLAALLEREAWARIAMLVIGWLTVVPGVLSVLALPLTSTLLEPAAVLSGIDGMLLAVLNVVTKGADLLYWLWAIYVLQFTPAVRAAFAGCGSASAPTPMARG